MIELLKNTELIFSIKSDAILNRDALRSSEGKNHFKAAMSEAYTMLHGPCGQIQHFLGHNGNIIKSSPLIF